MKKTYTSLLVLIVMSVLLAGCFNFGPGNSTTIVMKTGDISFSMDFSTVSQTISQIKVICTNPMYVERIHDLVINGKMATGMIEDLEEGMWHIRVEVYNDLSVLIYSGENDVNITNGVTATVDFSFTEATPAPNGGDLVINVVINDFPDHIMIPQYVEQVIPNPMGTHLYIRDGARKIITRYDLAGYNKMAEYQLPEMPTCMAISPDDTKLYVGFDSGHVGYIDIMAGNLTILTNLYVFVEDITIAHNYLVVRSVGAMDHTFYLIDMISGAVVNTTVIAPNTPLERMTFNMMTSKIYFSTAGLEPITLYSMSVDPVGMFGPFKSTILPAGDFGGSIHFLYNETQLLTPAGNRYQCASDDLNDLVPMGNIGSYTYWDMVVDTMGSRMFLINRYDDMVYDPATTYINILGVNDYFDWGDIPLEGHPKYVFCNPDNISLTLLVEKDYQWYFKNVMLP